MGVAVAITFDQWVAAYPEFTGTTQTSFNLYYTLAQSFHRNDGGGPVATAALQTNLLLLMVSHLVQGFEGTPANPASPNDPVGRVVSAGQGSINASFDASIPSGTPQWYAQTKYGFAYWTLTQTFRTMRYIPHPGRPLSPIPYR